jgi:hypothetical protein
VCVSRKKRWDVPIDTRVIVVVERTLLDRNVTTTSTRSMDTTGTIDMQHVEYYESFRSKMTGLRQQTEQDRRRRRRRRTKTASYEPAAGETGSGGRAHGAFLERRKRRPHYRAHV